MCSISSRSATGAEKDRHKEREGELVSESRTWTTNFVDGVVLTFSDVGPIILKRDEDGFPVAFEFPGQGHIYWEGTRLVIRNFRGQEVSMDFTGGIVD